MSCIRRKAIEGLKVGDAFSVKRTFSEEEVIRFAEISRDFNPVHFDERFAKAKNLDACICHGLLVAGMITEIGGADRLVGLWDGFQVQETSVLR